MSSTDIEYFRERAVLERRMAEGAFTPSSAAAHRRMAEANEDLVSRFDDVLPELGDEALSEPSEVSAQEGEVIVDGPDGVDVKFTPEAAIETADRLLEAGAEAQGQRLAKANAGQT